MEENPYESPFAESKVPPTHRAPSRWPAPALAVAGFALLAFGFWTGATEAGLRRDNDPIGAVMTGAALITLAALLKLYQRYFARNA